MENVRQLDIYHIYAHGRGNTSGPWNDLADTLAKKAVDGYITMKVGPFKIDILEKDDVEETSIGDKEIDEGSAQEKATEGTTNIFIDAAEQK